MGGIRPKSNAAIIFLLFKHQKVGQTYFLMLLALPLIL